MPAVLPGERVTGHLRWVQLGRNRCDTRAVTSGYENGNVPTSHEKRSNINDNEFLALDASAVGVHPIPAPDAATTTVVGVAVASFPTPSVPSTQRLCGACGETIWLAKHDPAITQFLAAGARTLCLGCAYDNGMSRGEMIVTRRTLDRAALAAAPRTRADA